MGFDGDQLGSSYSGFCPQRVIKSDGVILEAPHSHLWRSMLAVIRPQLRLTEGTPTRGLFMCLGFPTAFMVSGFHKQVMGKQSQVEGALLFMTSPGKSAPLLPHPCHFTRSRSWRSVHSQGEKVRLEQRSATEFTDVLSVTVVLTILQAKHSYAQYAEEEIKVSWRKCPGMDPGGTDERN